MRRARAGAHTLRARRFGLARFLRNKFRARTEFGRAVLYPSDDQRAALDLIAKLLEPNPTLRLENFPSMQAVRAHAFVSTGTLVAEKLKELKKQSDDILVGVNAVRALSEEHRGELRKTRFAPASDTSQTASCLRKKYLMICGSNQLVEMLGLH